MAGEVNTGTYSVRHGPIIHFFKLQFLIYKMQQFHVQRYKYTYLSIYLSIYRGYIEMLR